MQAENSEAYQQKRVKVVVSKDSQLFLHEEILLLGLRDEQGTAEAQAGFLGVALGGGLLAELLLSKAIRIVGSHDKIEVGASQLEDPLLKECWAHVERAKRARPAAMWVGEFSRLHGLRNRIAEGLCERGILQQSETKVLGLFGHKVYPTVDPEPERELIARLRATVLEDAAVDERDEIILSIANATGMLPVFFEAQELRQHAVRLQQIVEGAVLAPTSGILTAVRATRTAVLNAAALSVVVG